MIIRGNTKLVQRLGRVLAFFFAAVFMVVGVANAAAPGLVAAYGFSEGTGSTVLDASGNGNTGTITGATWSTQGRFGSALLFNGTSARINVPASASLDLGAMMTLEAWIYPTASQDGWRTIVQRQIDAYFLNASNSNGPLLPAGGGNIGGSTLYVSGNTPNALNTWTHVALTYDGATLRLYVNGVQAASQARTGSIQTSSNPLWIGGNSPYGEYFQGYIDEVRVYNRALAVTEIQTDMATAVQPAGPDTISPTAPTNLSAMGVSSSQISLSWTASTDNVGVSSYQVERCQGAGCSNFVQVATPAGTTYNDTGLAVTTSYSYRVRATDAAGNLSGYSNTASATTATAAPNLTLTLTKSGTGAGTVASSPAGISCGATCSALFASGTSVTLTSTATGGSMAAGFSGGCTSASTTCTFTITSNVTVTAAFNDTQAPIAPSHLTGIAAGSSQIDLSWTASSDNIGVNGYRVERCQGTNCSNFVQIFTLSGTTFSNTGLAANTAYRYRVRAVDAAGNLSAYSAIVRVTTTVTTTTTSTTTSTTTTTRPITTTSTTLTTTTTTITSTTSTTTRPTTTTSTTLTTTTTTITSTTTLPVTTTSITLTTTTTTITSTTTLPVTTTSTTLATTTTTTTSTTTTTQPTATVGLVAAYGFSEGTGSTVLDASGNGNTGTITGATWSTQGRFGSALLFNGTSARISVPASVSLDLGAMMTLEAWIYPTASQDGWRTIVQRQPDSYFLNASNSNGPLLPAGGGNIGGSTLYVSGNTPNALNTWTHVALTYDGATLRLYVNGVQAASQARTGSIQTSSNPLWIGGNSPYGEYFQGYIDEVRVYNRALAVTEIQTDMATAVQPAGPDTISPTAPTNLSPLTAGNSQINLSWTGSTDNVGVSSYQVERCQGSGCSNFAQIGALVVGTTYNDTGLAATTSYSYRVRATDAAGNLSGYSNTASATTAAGSSFVLTLTKTGTGAGTVTSSPAGIDCGATCSASFNSGALVTLTAAAASGSTGTGFSGGCVSATTTCTFTITSNVTVTAAFNDTQAPTAPSNLTATAGSSSQINLSWIASTDNVGVTGYQVERCQGSGCGNFAQIVTPAGTTYNDTGLTASTSYSYRVRATDAAGNLGAYSNTAGATTSSGSSSSAGLVAAYGFSEGTGSTVLDASGNGNTGTITGATWSTQGRFGSALLFNGTSARISVPASVSLDLGAMMTLEAWIYPTASQDGWRTIVQRQPDSYFLNASNSNGPLLPAGGGNIGGSTLYVSGNTPNALNTWTHVALTYDGATLRLYVNGVQAASQARTGSIQTSSNPLWIGGNSPYGEYFQGYIDEVRVYNRALAVTEIQTDMATAVQPAGPDTISPTAPTNLSAMGVSSSQISLSWTASTDNVGVSSYQVERCQGAGCSNFVQVATPAGTTYNDTGLAVTTSYSYRVRATDAAGNLSGYSNMASATTTTPDTVSPTVPTGLTAAPTSPSQISLSWTASTDNVGVSSYLIERCQGAGCSNFAQVASSTATTYPDTGLTAVTSYNYRVRAADASGNLSAYSNVASATTPASTEAQVGQWSGILNWPLVSVHGAVLTTGQVLLWDYDTSGQGVQLWNPATNALTAVPYNAANLFCAGLAHLPDGRLLVAGGHVSADYVGISNANLFNPTTQSWSTTGSMAFPRWYPTVTTLSDGRMLVTSGSDGCRDCIVDVPEIYNPATSSWTRLDNAALSISLYPHMFLLPDGRVLVTGSYESSQVPVVTRALDINAQTWTTIDPVPVNGGSAVMYSPGKVMTAGLSTMGGPGVDPTPSAATTYVLDMNLPLPKWRQTASMAFKRDYNNLTVLPDGNVLVTGGGQTAGATDGSTAVFEAEMWSPATETWTTLARMQIPRLYHSIALLLPDGRVLVSGGGRDNGVGSPTNDSDHLNAEVFSPPYLFKGQRPTITSAPATVQYGANFSVTTPNASNIASVSLIKLGAATHAFNMDQRFVPLTFQQGSGSLTVQSPANGNFAPPGHYMLFIVDGNGVPSVASIVKIQ